MLVAVSVFAAGYVIFFRTVFAGEISTAVKSGIVFEEPDPPVHEDPITDIPDKKPLLEKQLPKVAIIIDDLGYHEKIGNKFLNFPIELTYSFLPFAPHSEKQEKTAFNSEKTVILHLPLEPKDPQWDPGPGALLLTDSLELQKNKLDQALAAVPHAVGVNSHMGSGYTESTEKMKSLLQYIRAKDLFFIDSFTTAKSVGLQMAQELGLVGWVRNLPDGRVEAWLQGDPQVVSSMLTWCYDGPDWARVDNIAKEDSPPDDSISGFRIRY